MSATKYVDSNGLLYVWGKIKALLGGKVDKATGKQLSTNDYTDTEKSKLAGLSNYSHPTGDGNQHVPATGTGNNGKFLRAGSTAGSAAWGGLTKEEIVALGIPGSDTTYEAATTSAPGLMSATDKAKLNGVAASANNYSHPTTSGNKHIPSGGSSGQFLKWSADGTAIWAADNDTTYGPMTGAASGTAGTAGLVPAPAAGKQASFLRGDGTWAAPANTTYGVATSSANGLMAKEDKAKLDAFGAASTYATVSALNDAVAGLYKYKGSKAAYANLPSTGNTTGDVWNVETDGMNYAWNGTAWDALGSAFSVEAITNAEIDAIFAQ